MKDNHEIDTKFLNKLGKLETPAPSESWDIIASRLDKKPRRSLIIPLWWKLAGVAALIMLALSIFDWKQEEYPAKNSVVVEEELDRNEKNETDDLVKDNMESSYKDAKITDRITDVQENAANAPIGKQPATSSSIPGMVNAANGNSLNKAFASSNNSKLEKAINHSRDERSAQEVVAGVHGSISNDLEDLSPVDRYEENNNLKLKGAVAMTDGASLITNPDSTKLEQLAEATVPALAVVDDSNDVDEKNDDDTAVAGSSKKWSASTVVAPMLASSLSGSSIGEQVSRDNQNTTTDLTYGIAIAYQINERWSVRAGLNQVNLSYDNGNINYGIDVANLLVDADATPTNFNRNAVSMPSNTTLFNSSSAYDQEVSSATVFKSLEGELSQRLGYLEIPLEVKYRLLDSKIGVSVLGGFSALILTDNAVSLTGKTTRLDLGEDQNFKNFNQSANLGMGLDYQFTQNIGLTLEPIFKYQLNAVDRDVTNFRPYTVGVYTGIIYKF